MMEERAKWNASNSNMEERANMEMATSSARPHHERKERKSQVICTQQKQDVEERARQTMPMSFTNHIISNINSQSEIKP
jgi:3-phenylpropionate/cinnamic acid dioxygenase small subunit